MSLGTQVTQYLILQKKVSYDGKYQPKYSLYKSTIYTKKRQCDLAFNFLYEELEGSAQFLPKNGYASVIKANDNGFLLAFYTKEGKATHTIEYYRREISLELPSDVSLRNTQGNIIMTLDEDMIPSVIATFNTKLKAKCYYGNNKQYHIFNYRLK